MKYKPLAKRLTPHRVCSLILQSDTFEEEIILTTLTKLLINGGRVHFEVPQGDDIVERTFEFTPQGIEEDDG